MARAQDDYFISTTIKPCNRVFYADNSDGEGGLLIKDLQPRGYIAELEDYFKV